MNNQQRKNHIRDFGITPLGCRTINVSWAQHDTSTKMCAHFCSPHFSFSAISVIGCSHDNHYFLSWSHKHNTGGRTTHMVAQHMVAQHMWSPNTGGRPTQVVVQPGFIRKGESQIQEHSRTFLGGKQICSRTFPARHPHI